MIVRASSSRVVTRAARDHIGVVYIEFTEVELLLKTIMVY